MGLIQKLKVEEAMALTSAHDCTQPFFNLFNIYFHLVILPHLPYYFHDIIKVYMEGHKEETSDEIFSIFLE
jgi:hypothetical protein